MERRKQWLRMKNPPWKTMREKINNNKQTNNLKIWQSVNKYLGKKVFIFIFIYRKG